MRLISSSFGIFPEQRPRFHLAMGGPEIRPPDELTSPSMSSAQNIRAPERSDYTNTPMGVGRTMLRTVPNLKLFRKNKQVVVSFQRIKVFDFNDMTALHPGLAESGRWYAALR